MRFLSSVSLLVLLAACDINGGAMPIDAKKFLSGIEGPKIDTMQDTQKKAALDAEQKGNFAAAIPIYQDMLDKDQNNDEIVLSLAEAFRRNAEYDKAIAAYDSLLKKTPTNIAAKEGKALALLSKGDFETPTPIFEDVLKTDNTRWKSLNGLGILFVTRGLNEDGEKYFETSLKYSPNNIAVLNNLGLASALNKNFDKAISSLTQASGISAVDSVQRKRIDLNLALVYASAGRLEDAQKLAEIYLSGPQLNNNLGLYAHLAKNDRLAKSYLNMALTDSKVYYEKAWENLETIDEAQSAKTEQKPQTGNLVASAPKATIKKDPDTVSEEVALAKKTINKSSGEKVADSKDSKKKESVKKKEEKKPADDKVNAEKKSDKKPEEASKKLEKESEYKSGKASEPVAKEVKIEEVPASEEKKSEDKKNDQVVVPSDPPKSTGFLTVPKGSVSSSTPAPTQSVQTKDEPLVTKASVAADEASKASDVKIAPPPMPTDVASPVSKAEPVILTPIEEAPPPLPETK